MWALGQAGTHYLAAGLRGESINRNTHCAVCLSCGQAGTHNLAAVYNYSCHPLLSLPHFPFVRGEVPPATSSPPHLIVFSWKFHPPLSLVFFFQTPSSPAFFTSLLTQSSHLSLGPLVFSCPPVLVHITY